MSHDYRRILYAEHARETERATDTARAERPLDWLAVRNRDARQRWLAALAAWHRGYRPPNPNATHIRHQA